MFKFSIFPCTTSILSSLESVSRLIDSILPFALLWHPKTHIPLNAQSKTIQKAWDYTLSENETKKMFAAAAYAADKVHLRAVGI